MSNAVVILAVGTLIISVVANMLLAYRVLHLERRVYWIERREATNDHE